MRNILKIFLLTIAILLLFYLFRILINITGIITNNHAIMNKLYLLNINEPYIVYYNDGNIYFNENNYQKAIKKYNKALKNKPPKAKYCIIKNKLIIAKIYSANNIDKIENIKKTLNKDNCITNKTNKIINSYKEKISIYDNNIRKDNDNAYYNRQLDIEKYENLSRYDY